MNKRQNKRIRILGNVGSTLVMVIVVVAFVSILATTLLYLVGENYKTKIYDLKTKESFYEAEELVDLFKASIIRDVAECSKPAYDSVVANYLQSEDKNTRSTEYLKQFKLEFDKRMEDRCGKTLEDDKIIVFSGGYDEGYVSDLLNEFIVLDGDEESMGITKNKDGLYNCTINGNPVLFKFEIIEDSAFYQSVNENLVFSDGEAASYYIGTIVITVIDEKTKYVSKISTAFMVTPPQLNWGNTGDVAVNKSTEIDYSDCVKYFNYVKE